MVGFLDAPVSTERSGGSGGGMPTSYGGTVPLPSAADEAAEAAARAEREARFLSDTSGKDYMDMLMSSPRSQGRGSASRAADSLAAVLAERAPGGEGEEGEEAIDPGMRMEEFTAAKEARLRALGGEVITRDLSYNPGGNVSVRVSMPGAGMFAGPEAREEAVTLAVAARRVAEAEQAEADKAAQEAWDRAEAAAAARASEAGTLPGTDGLEGQEEGDYKPKVSTWGMFPRPADISKAYGGGRNIKPGQELETPAQRAERERGYAAALAAYKTKAGLEVDPEDEERAAVIYAEGMVLFNAGELQASYDKFDKVLGIVPVKTKFGGMATLQKAIVLDSVGKSDLAQKLYKSIANHGVSQVARKAKQMLSSFEAMTFLKADQFTYAPKKDEFAKYFRGFADRSTVYVASEAERLQDDANARFATLVALAVILGPVVAVAALAVQR